MSSSDDTESSSKRSIPLSNAHDMKSSPPRKSPKIGDQSSLNHSTGNEPIVGVTKDFAVATPDTVKKEKNVESTSRSFLPTSDGTKSKEVIPGKNAWRGPINTDALAPGSKVIPVGKKDCFSNLKFVVTGIFEALSKDGVLDLIKRYGGKVFYCSD